MFDLTATLQAAKRNYEKLIPKALQDLSFERAELDQVRRMTGKLPGSYDLATKDNLCFDSAVLYWHALQKEEKLAGLRFAISRGMDHAFLVCPAGPRTIILVDPSWKQFYVAFSAVNPELFKALPEVLILKDFSKVQTLMRQLDAIFCPSALAPPSRYYEAYDTDTPDCMTQRLLAEKILNRYEAQHKEKEKAQYSVSSAIMSSDRTRFNVDRPCNFPSTHLG